MTAKLVDDADAMDEPVCLLVTSNSSRNSSNIFHHSLPSLAVHRKEPAWF